MDNTINTTTGGGPTSGQARQSTVNRFADNRLIISEKTGEGGLEKGVVTAEVEEGGGKQGEEEADPPPDGRTSGRRATIP